MEPDWKAISKNISKYIDNETFLSARKPIEICSILDNAKLSPNEFTILFTNLSKYHGKSDMLMMLGRARTSELATQEEVDKISRTISSVLGVSLLDKVFTFSQNNAQSKNSNSQNSIKEEFSNITVTMAHQKCYVFEKISLNTTIENFKLKIQNILGIPVNNQLLYACNAPISSSGTLKQYGEYASFHLLDGVAISYGGYTYPIDIDNYDITVEELKHMFKEEVGWQVIYQAIFYNGITLQNNRTLRYYKIQRGSTIEASIHYNISAINRPPYTQIF
ncbi:Ubiquitin family protein [Trichomonas vaginalis G3]|uniref:Ubiquitin family protein n=1 Tax=Trichomonas vaginalis (strain ATCC PRA-98 / G3) TaxID=412133 RepID=A2DNL5_TRIV3|nr:cellular macromolecule catabolic process [Trichomonas vaginalis G3]EAY18018.1 Ubiquitin family protein [Trichomonas vaginalis G3]KAI5524424.1 cellular macromolecule catabolic process [Trichomonas vaginalis G3]|eukprot:XP_001579004.1 Ubiquitin family protein [Trichomonas vaginalis G3]